jgi:PilZ domain
MEHRISDRRPSRVELEVRALGRKFFAHLYDLSATGCRFNCAGSYVSTGDRIVFKFAQNTTVKGKIVWRNGAIAGVRFAAPLPPALSGHGHTQD